MLFDEVLKKVGEFGRYQKIQYFLLCLVSIVSAWHSLNMVFVGANPKHHCDISNLKAEIEAQLGNLSSDKLLDLGIPMIKKKGKTERDSCNVYHFDVASVPVASVEILNDSTNYDVVLVSSTGQQFIANKTTKGCSNGWVYSTNVYGKTIVSEWDLVCDQKWLRSTTKSVFFAGRLVGALLFGQLSDKFGRRPIFFIAVALQVVTGMAVSFSPNTIAFIILYFFQGVMQVGVFLTAFVIGTELVGPSKRKVAGFVIQYFYSIGFMLLAGIAYLVRDWQYIEWTITLPGILFGLYWFIIPESARWLLSQGRNEEALEIMQRVAKANNVQLNKETLEDLNPKKGESQRKTYTVIDLVRYRKMAAISFNVWFNWSVNALVYYGLSLNTDNLGGDPYLNFAIAGAVEIPAYTLCLLLLDRTGRRKLLCAFMLIGGVACIVTTFIPAELAWLSITFSMTGKFAITASYAIIYLMAAELFPTVLRNIGMGISSVSARIGGILAPQILRIGDYSGAIPMIIFGGMSIIAGGLAMLLPETLGKPLPQTLEDVLGSGFSQDVELEVNKNDKETEEA